MSTASHRQCMKGCSLGRGEEFDSLVCPLCAIPRVGSMTWTGVRARHAREDSEYTNMSAVLINEVVPGSADIVTSAAEAYNVSHCK
jgi:hypothetical protein